MEVVWLVLAVMLAVMLLAVVAVFVLPALVPVKYAVMCVMAMLACRKGLPLVGLCMRILPRIGYDCHVQALVAPTVTSGCRIPRLEPTQLELLAVLWRLDSNLPQEAPAGEYRVLSSLSPCPRAHLRLGEERPSYQEVLAALLVVLVGRDAQ